MRGAALLVAAMLISGCTTVAELALTVRVTLDCGLFPMSFDQCRSAQSPTPKEQ